MAALEPAFSRFSELPTELRLQIWALSIPTRLIPITCTKGIHWPSRRFAQRFNTTTPPPSLLLCNRESRSIALDVYASHFRTAERPHGIVVSFTQDTFSFPDNTISYLKAGDRELIQRMVLAVKDYQYFGYFNFTLLRGMAALRELVLLVGNGVVNSWGGEDPAGIILGEFRTEAKEWREWEVPSLVRIMHIDTGEVLCYIRGRAGLGVDEEEGQ